MKTTKLGRLAADPPVLVSETMIALSHILMYQSLGHPDLDNQLLTRAEN